MDSQHKTQLLKLITKRQGERVTGTQNDSQTEKKSGDRVTDRQTDIKQTERQTDRYTD